MPPKQPKPRTLQKVAPISEMDRKNFCLHMTARHNDSLAGMGELPFTIDEPTEGSYRAFHKRLHETRIDLEHEHDKGDPIQHWQDLVKPNTQTLEEMVLRVKGRHKR